MCGRAGAADGGTGGAAPGGSGAAGGADEAGGVAAVRASATERSVCSVIEGLHSGDAAGGYGTGADQPSP
ncbi:hypothetical protein ADL29_29350 [Streptomyces chattanoogensis]|uniref:Uncharacterized protein n=1 Tax=Streptomyces chattanoogensis TaxID=66876 RepID=A0A0N0XSH9_9ACTN|nr:hypothetical protein ADL29_29350 [Streptomyces chattanoogensis]